MFQINNLINQIDCIEVYDKSILITIINKLIKKTKIDEITGCWLWMGETYGKDTKGKINYGKIKFLNSYKPIHRLVAHLFLKLNLNLTYVLACHKIECLNKHCWNPNHIYVGNYLSNYKDAIKTGARKSITELRGTKKANCIHNVKDNCKKCRKEYMKIYNRKYYLENFKK